MHDDPLADSLDDPRLVPFLPMVYVAWADGDLDGEEMKAICREIGSRANLNEPCRTRLGRWLDPDTPPAARDLQRLLGGIRARTEKLSRRERISLAELGLEMARASGGVSEVERDALVSIERQLGIVSSEAARQLLASRRPARGPVRFTPAFPVTMLARYLDGDQRPLRQRVRALLATPEFAYREYQDREAYRAQVLAWCKRLAAEGWGALGFPEDVGGGGSTAAFIAVFETLGHHDLSLLVKFGVQYGLWGGSVHQLGTERHHRRYLPPTATLELPGCFAMSETGHGSNVQDLETTARFDPERDVFVIHTPHPGARKDWIGNAARDGLIATVFAQLEIGAGDPEEEGKDIEEHGVHAFVVPIRDAETGAPLPGVTIEDDGPKMGLNGVDNGRLLFDRVEIPRGSLLDRFASVDEEGNYSSPIPSPGKRFFTMLGTLVGGRVSVALAATSVAKSALAIAVRYGNRRRQFGPPGEPEIALLDYRAHQRRLLPRLATTYALHFALRALAARYAASAPDDDRREIEHLAAGLKARATWHCTDTVQTCREACGGQGYLAVNRFAAMKADSDVFTTFEGDNTVLLQLVAKGLLTGYKQQFHDINLFGMARYVARRARSRIAALNPVVVRRKDEAHLRDPDFHRDAFTWREQHLVASVARRLKARIDRGMDSADALNECQDHLLEAAKANVERIVLEHFRAGVDAAPEEVREVLERLYTLHALWVLEEDRGWFLEHGYLEGGKAKAIRKLVNALCAELRPDAEALVDAFAIPPEVLAAPIAR